MSVMTPNRTSVPMFPTNLRPVCGSEQRNGQMMRGPSNKMNEGPHEESAFALHGEKAGPV